MKSSSAHDRSWFISVFSILGFAASLHSALLPVDRSDNRGFAIPHKGFPFSFPRDHGSHPEFKIEWWYLTGHLFSPQQRRFGFQATFFRSALHPPPAADQEATAFGRDQIYLAHMALVDVSSRTYLAEERINRNGWDAAAALGDLDVRNGNWRLRRDATEHHKERMTLQASVLGGAVLELELIPEKPLVVFGQEGVSRKGTDATAASYYLTFPRLRASGTLKLNGTALAVHGQAWMDHEISSSQLTTNQVGWDWVSIQLNDGREIMLYLMRTKSGEPDPNSTLAWVERDGQVKHKNVTEFTWQATRRWRSPETGGNYPIEIVLTTQDPASKRALTLRISPVLERQELVGKLSGISYWEGACDVLNEQGQQVGKAYLELTGYAKDLSPAR